MSYATPKGHVFLDRRLYLPEEWCHDAERRAQAKVPEDVSFQTKPEQAMAMLEQAWQAGVPMRWVAGDEVYGDATELRDLVARHGRWYVLAVRTPTRCGPNAPQWSNLNRRNGVARGPRCAWRTAQPRRRRSKKWWPAGPSAAGSGWSSPKARKG